MSAVWKFPLQVTDEQTIEAPADFKALSVHVQNGIPCLWAQVTGGAELLTHRVWVAGTGHPLRDGAANGRFVGSFLLHGGALVFHVFVEAGR